MRLSKPFLSLLVFFLLTATVHSQNYSYKNIILAEKGILSQKHFSFQNLDKMFFPRTSNSKGGNPVSQFHFIHLSPKFDIFPIIDTIAIHQGAPSSFKHQVYNYDEKGRMTREVYERLDNEDWVNEFCNTNEFDEYGHLSSSHHMSWTENGWEECCFDAYEYDDEDNLISRTVKFFYDSVWSNCCNDIYEYDENNNLTSIIMRMWYDSTWNNDMRRRFLYDENENLIAQYEEHWEEGGWAPALCDTFIYDEQNRLNKRIHNEWQNSQWENSYYDTLSYNSNNFLVRSLRREKETDHYVNCCSHTYEYDEQDNLTSIVKQVWENKGWVNDTRNLFSYNSSNLLITCLFETWNGTDWETATYDNYYTIIMETNGYINVYSFSGNSALIHYSTITEVGDNENETPNSFVLNQNYPNPFNPTTVISYSIPNLIEKSFSNAGMQSVNVTLTIYNTLGQKVATLVNEVQTPGNYKVKFEVSDLPSGIYFYTLRAGEYVATKKMILMK
jgi:hypothetical protein